MLTLLAMLMFSTKVWAKSIRPEQSLGKDTFWKKKRL